MQRWDDCQQMFANVYFVGHFYTNLKIGSTKFVFYAIVGAVLISQSDGVLNKVLDL